jgi:hypothetical protein
LRRVALLSFWLFAGCAQIIGLDDRDFVGDIDSGTMLDGAVVGDAGALSCEHYCSLALDRCKMEQGVQLYSELKRCMGVCQAFPVGDPANPTGNTRACRIAQLEKLAPGDVLESRTYCPGAGPGGSAPKGEGEHTACGKNCESFCRIRQVVCPGEQAETECLRKCAALPDLEGYNASDDFAGGADNIQCRLAHLSAAAGYHFANEFGDRDGHCAHSNIKSSVQCDLKKDQAPDCKELCEITQTACAVPGLKVYDNEAQCEAVCNVLEAGTGMALTANNRRCRREFAYDALVRGASPSACENAGPAPRDCGQGKCATYCELARKACEAKFDSTFAGATPAEKIATCQTECAKNPDIGMFYNLPTPDANTLNCRLRRTAAAFIDPRECDNAIGNGGFCML